MRRAADSFTKNSYHVFVFLTAVSVRITSPRCYPAQLGVLSAASFCSFVRAGDPRLEDKVPREFSGLAVRENASTTKLRADREKERERERTEKRDRKGEKEKRYEAVCRPINIYQD